MYKQQKQSQLKKLTREFLKGTVLLESGNVEQLRDLLRFHEWKYYVLNDPLISDYEYDILFDKLKELESRHPKLITPESPTQRVATDLTKEFASAEHTIPMLSLDNSYNENDLVDWDKRVRGFLGDQQVTYSVEPKFDGSSIALIYENDNLSRGATRGNGISGEDVTVNIKVIRSIPLKAGFSGYQINKAELRGEILIRKDYFKKFNEMRIEEGLQILANPRNAAAGSLRMQDAREVSRRGLEAYIYQVAYAEDTKNKSQLKNKLKSHFESLQMAYQLGFRSPVNEMKLCHSIEEVLVFCNEWEEKRDDYPYEIDGMVIKVNDFGQQELCGSTSHHPRWAIAYKFKARQSTTRLTSIEYQIGRTGAVTPVAKLEPIGIGGVMVSSVSLFNEDFVREKDLMIGDTVLVERAGDVIPYIVKPLIEYRDGKQEKIIFPGMCPSCRSELVKPEGEAAWRCVNINCPAQAVERIIHYVSKNAMDIEGLGNMLVRKFYPEKIKTIIDIYDLDFDMIADLEGFGRKSADNLKTSIENSKVRDLDRLLFALGIRYVGRNTSKILANLISDIEELQNWDKDKLLEIEDIGPKVAESITEFFGNADNLRMIHDLIIRGVNTKRLKKAVVGGILSGKSFLFTGTLSEMTRTEAQRLVEENGGKILSSVSKNLDYLVIGSSPGSKKTKAEKIDSIIIIEEDDFLRLIT